MKATVTPVIEFPEPPRAVCLVRLSAIGDVSHVVPVVRTLQHYWPDTRLTWIVGRVEAGLVGDLPGVEFIRYDKAGGLRSWLALRRELRGRRFDLLLQMQTAMRAATVGAAVPARLRLGYDRDRSREGHSLVINRRVAPHPRYHVLDGFFDFPRALGMDERILRWDIPVPDDARAFAAQHLPDAEAVLAINPASSVRPFNYRNWVPERYAAVADHAVRRHGMRVVLTGGPSAGERELADAIVASMQTPVIDLVGRTSLKQLLAVLERSSALIAPDTGPAHIGTAAGIPVIGLYGTSNPDRTGPYLSRQWVVNRYPENLERYCGVTVEHARWGMRVRHADAMRAITVEDVTERLAAVMEARSGRGS